MEVWAALAAIPGIGPALPYLAALCVLCATLATKLPAPAAHRGGYYWVYTIINWIGLNIGEALNAKAPEAKGVEPTPTAGVTK